MSETLTRTDQVLAVLRAGGSAGFNPTTRLWALFDAQGRQLNAWQNAIKAAAAIQEKQR